MNLTGPFLGCQQFAALMLGAHNGSIINVAAAVAFLADPTRSGFINGVALPVDGGWTTDASWTALRLRKRRT